MEQGGQVHCARSALSSIYASLLPAECNKQSIFVSLSPFQIVKASGGRIAMDPSEQYNAEGLAFLGLEDEYPSGLLSSKTRVQGRNVNLSSSNAMLRALETNIPFRVFTVLPKNMVKKDHTLIDLINALEEKVLKEENEKNKQ